MRVATVSCAVLLGCLATLTAGASINRAAVAEISAEKLAPANKFDTESSTEKVHRAARGLISGSVAAVANTVSDVGTTISNSLGAPVVGEAITAVTDGVIDVTNAVTNPVGGLFGRPSRSSSRRRTSSSSSRKTLVNDPEKIASSASTIQTADDPVKAVADLVGDVGEDIAGNGIVGSSIRAVTDTVGRVSTTINKGKK